MGLSNSDTTLKITPAFTKIYWENVRMRKKCDQNLHYRSVIGKLNYLENSTLSEITYAVRQCAQFSKNPRKTHGEAVNRIGRYLKGTKNWHLYTPL